MSLLFSSLLSLAIGTIVGLLQSRIKKLYAFSTISHVGFILLGLSIHSIESTQAFMFYLMQYSISNLNAFMLIITIGYSLYSYVYKDYDSQYIPYIDDPYYEPYYKISSNPYSNVLYAVYNRGGSNVEQNIR
jgi:NADH:ubiquinone oxidoreductase subunit 5 (subunit L)/multisubunit Na+/H+ antiporter MnhA subunit